MKKSQLALVLIVCMLIPIAASCKKPESIKNDNSSVIASEESEISSGSSKNSPSKNSDKNKESSKSSTTSYDASFLSTDIPDDNNDDYYDYDNDDTSSSTESQSIKLNRDGLKIGMYHMSMRWCDSYGYDFESREREFREVVEAGYFNTYFLHAQDYSIGYLLKEIEIIAENGGTFWMTLWNYHSDNKLLDRSEKLEDHEASLRKIIDAITRAGYRDYLMGMIWDEPIWNGQENKDFLAQSELYYKKFGLRTFPVFATGEFSGIEGNLSTSAEKMGKVATEALKYVTDVAFDSYGVDVRLEDEYRYGAQMNRYFDWADELGVTVTNGRDYYTGYKELLKKRVGHDVNIWYFPTAFNWPTSNGGEADEEFCMAHLKFMAEEVMKEKYQGGLALYTYYSHKPERIAFAQRCDLKFKDGTYKRYPEYDKWTDYCKLLRETKIKFDSIKAKTVNLGL